MAAKNRVVTALKCNWSLSFQSCLARSCWIPDRDRPANHPPAYTCTAALPAATAGAVGSQQVVADCHGRGSVPARIQTDPKR
jgi:hypothetical protein